MFLPWQFHDEMDHFSFFRSAVPASLNQCGRGVGGACWRVGIAEDSGWLTQRIRWLKTAFYLANDSYKFKSVKNNHISHHRPSRRLTEPKWLEFFFPPLVPASAQMQPSHHVAAPAARRLRVQVMIPLPRPSPPAFPLCRRVGWEKFRASILRRKLPAKPWQKRVESITTLAVAHIKSATVAS